MQMRERKRALGPEEKEKLDKRLCDRVVRHPEFQKARCVYGYASLPTEAGTWEILKAVLDSGKRLALPRVEGTDMKFYYVSTLDDLSEGVFHIKEPNGFCPPAGDQKALVLVPGTAFTRDGKRLGKGGGYYDRFLSDEPEHRTIGLAYGFQVVEELFEESHDRRVLEVLTPEESIQCDGICP